MRPSIEIAFQVITDGLCFLQHQDVSSMKQIECAERYSFFHALFPFDVLTHQHCVSDRSWPERYLRCP